MSDIKSDSIESSATGTSELLYQQFKTELLARPIETYQGLHSPRDVETYLRGAKDCLQWCAYQETPPSPSPVKSEVPDTRNLNVIIRWFRDEVKAYKQVFSRAVPVGGANAVLFEDWAKRLETVRDYLDTQRLTLTGKDESGSEAK